LKPRSKSAQPSNSKIKILKRESWQLNNPVSRDVKRDDVSSLSYNSEGVDKSPHSSEDSSNEGKLMDLKPTTPKFSVAKESVNIDDYVKKRAKEREHEEKV